MKLLNAAELTWDELRKEAQRGSLFMLCVAPLEDHASHLPSGTDPLICEAMATHTARLVTPVDGIEYDPQPTNVVLLPTWSQGSSLLQSLGCLRWKSSTVTQTLVEYGGELDKLGVRRLVLLSSHGAMDHLRALEKAARYLRKRTRMNVLAPSGPMLNDFVMGKFNSELLEHLGRPFTDDEARGLKGDVHAAAWETSLLLHIAPRLVEKTYRNLPEHAIFTGKKLKFKALRYHRGYFGAPAVASEELGKAAFEMLCAKMADRLNEFVAKPLRHHNKRGLTPRVKKPKKRIPTARVPVNIAIGLFAGWLLFRAMDRQAETKRTPLRSVLFVSAWRLLHCGFAALFALSGRSHPGLSGLLATGAGFGGFFLFTAASGHFFVVAAAAFGHLVFTTLFLGRTLLGLLLGLLFIGAAILPQNGHSQQSDANNGG